jgi:phosphatidylserine/phosphatidylglycerophosphate/cardiolipin synthase-like enzyme
MNGIQVKHYATTTFYHAKYMSRDKKAASVSSINFSKTSYTKNREAGVLLEGNADALSFLTSVYETDWATATAIVVNNTYSDADLSIIKSTAKRSYNMPTIDPQMAPTPKPAAVTDATSIKVYTSPDSAHETLMAQLTGAKKSVSVEIYQVTDDTLCSFISQSSKSVNISLLVSRYVFGPADHTLATACYTKLHSLGVTVRMTQDLGFYQYCHQKFWIVDGTTVGLSTGNWSPSDYPEGGDLFVPYNTAGWRVSNRDYTTEITSAGSVDVFQGVFDKDYTAGSDFSPSTNPLLLAL